MDLQHYCYGECQSYHEMERVLIGISNIYQLNLENIYLPYSETAQRLLKGSSLNTWKRTILFNSLDGIYSNILDNPQVGILHVRNGTHFTTLYTRPPVSNK